MGFAGLIAALLVVLAGCQSVGGVDLNQVLLNNAELQSYEGKQSITLELEPADQADLPAEAAKVLQLLNGLTLDFTDVKVQDLMTMSAEGELRLAGGSVPLRFTTNAEEMVLDIEGADKPLVLRMNELMQVSLGDETDPLGGVGAVGGLPTDVGGMLSPEQYQQVQAILSQVVEYLPNPSKVDVSDVTETINGESVELKKIHAEIQGPELIGLFKELLNNLIADEEGFKALIKTVLDMSAATMPEEEALPFSSDFMAEFAYAMLIEALPDLEQSIDEMMDNPEMQAILGNLYVNVDLYVDADLQLRKQGLEMYIGLPEDSGVSGIKVTSSSEMWNLNGEVAADAIDTTDALAIDNEFKLARFLKTLDPESALYQLLINDLKLASKQISMTLSADGKLEYEGGPYIKNNASTMVPVRFVSEELDADVLWDGEKRQVTVIDIWTGKTIVLTLDSNIAYVDGEAVELETEAGLVGNLTYVPVRFIAEQLGAEVGWDGKTRTVTIVRE